MPCHGCVRSPRKRRTGGHDSSRKKSATDSKLNERVIIEMMNPAHLRCTSSRYFYPLPTLARRLVLVRVQGDSLQAREGSSHRIAMKGGIRQIWCGIVSLCKDVSTEARRRRPRDGEEGNSKDEEDGHDNIAALISGSRVLYRNLKVWYGEFLHWTADFAPRVPSSQW